MLGKKPFNLYQQLLRARACVCVCVCVCVQPLIQPARCLIDNGDCCINNVKLITVRRNPTPDTKNVSKPQHAGTIGGNKGERISTWVMGSRERIQLSRLCAISIC